MTTMTKQCSEMFSLLRSRAAIMCMAAMVIAFWTFSVAAQGIAATSKNTMDTAARDPFIGANLVGTWGGRVGAIGEESSVAEYDRTVTIKRGSGITGTATLGRPSAIFSIFGSDLVFDGTFGMGGGWQPVFKGKSKAGTEITFYQTGRSPGVARYILRAWSAQAYGGKGIHISEDSIMRPVSTGSAISRGSAPTRSSNPTTGYAAGSPQIKSDSKATASSQQAKRNPAPAVGSPGSQKAKTSPEYAPIVIDCVEISQGAGKQSAFKNIKNQCSVPVRVLMCFSDNDRYPATHCDNPPAGWSTSNRIPVNGRTSTADAVGSPWSVEYYVCDATNDSSPCIHPARRKR